MCTDHVWIYHGNWLSWAVWPAVAGRVSDRINHHVQRGGKKWISLHESVVGKWAYIKELAVVEFRGLLLGLAC